MFVLLSLNLLFGYKINGLFVRFKIGKLIVFFLGFKDINVSPNSISFCHKKAGQKITLVLTLHLKLQSCKLKKALMNYKLRVLK